jgi:hypothetical protein
MRNYTSTFLVLFLLSPIHFVTAEKTFNLDDITGVLQSEYQQQLKRSKTNRNKKAAKQVRKKPVQAKRKAPARRVPVQTPKKRQTPVHRGRLKVQKRKKNPAVGRAQAQRKIARPPRRHYVPTTPRASARNILNADTKTLLGAAKIGNVALINQLLSRNKININSTNNEGETALHIASANGHYSTVIYLINHGANIHSRTIKNWRPLHHATRFRHAVIANYLKARGASPFERTSDGLNAVDIAINNHDQRLVSILGAGRNR